MFFWDPTAFSPTTLIPAPISRKTGDSLVSTRVRTRATIGANATIVCGITIGQYAFIGAGTVVIRDVPDFAMMVGNPARQIGWMCVCATKLVVTLAPRF